MLRKVSDLENRLARPEAPLLTVSALRRSHLGSPLRGAAEYTDFHPKRQAYFCIFLIFFRIFFLKHSKFSLFPRDFFAGQEHRSDESDENGIGNSPMPFEKRC